MRDFLEQLPKDDHDDFFSTTPLQNRRVLVSLKCILYIDFYIFDFYIWLVFIPDI